MACYTVVHKLYNVDPYRIQKSPRGKPCGAPVELVHASAIKTPGTRITWFTLKEWMDAWKRIAARAASSKRHEQRAAHVAQLASNICVVNRETDIETLAAVKQLIEYENILKPRGMRAGHPATEILQRVGTVLSERRRAAAEADACANRKCWKAAA